MTLVSFKSELKQLLISKPNKVIIGLQEKLKPSNKKINELIQLESTYRFIQEQYRHQTITFDNFIIQKNKFTNSLLVIIDSLTNEDIDNTGSMIDGALRYSQGWDTSRDWYINKRGKLLNFVAARMNYVESGANIENTIAELEKIMFFITNFLVKQPMDSYEIWFKKQLKEYQFQSNDIDSLLNSLDYLSEQIDELSKRDGIPPKIVANRYKAFNEKTKTVLRE